MTMAITDPQSGTPRVAAPTVGGDDRHAAHRQTDAAALSLVTLLADLPADSPDRSRVRARLIELYLPLARHMARRFDRRGEPLDDLVQVANLGLIKAVDGFDGDRGTVFTSYAIPMIAGELKRHFRDKCWDVRVPRRIQELHLQITRVTEALTHDLGRSPTVADLATRLNVGEEEVLEALEGAQAYRTLSLDTPTRGSEDSTHGLGDLLGATDPDIEQVEAREALRPLLAQLPAREQRIIALRFFGNLTQSQIAANLGISQMHVSRLLAHALGKLRTSLLHS